MLGQFCFKLSIYLCLLTGFISAAQTDSLYTGSRIEITLKDNEIYSGMLINQDSLAITIETANELTIRIPRSRIRNTTLFSEDTLYAGYKFADPNDSRMFFGPTARTLPAGRGYFADYYIFFPFLGYGVTDFLTLAGGISLFPGATSQIFYLAPKLHIFNVGKFDLASGLLYLRSTDGEMKGAGIAYGVSTYGSPNNSVTIGAGWGFTEGDLYNKPVIMIGGETRISNSFKLVSENWIPPSTDVILLSAGFRFFGKNLAADLAFMYPARSEIEGFPFIPWIDFVYNFGKDK